MPALLHKCINCRAHLPEGAVNVTQCHKCQKNQARFGPPGTCKYCQLNAAFREQICVWCSDAVRRTGKPFACANCKLICAFARRDSDKHEDNALLCRLCIQQARQTNQKVLNGVPVPQKKDKSGDSSSDHHRHHRSSHRHKDRKEHHRKDDKSRHHHHHESSRHAHKRRHPEETEKTNSSFSGVPPLAPNNENGTGIPIFGALGENIEKHQRMEDEIRRLKATIIEKDQQLFEKDKQINRLKAEVFMTEKEHRDRLHKINKEKEDNIRVMESIRSSKISKKN